MDWILPFAITTAWSSFAAAPVPSITRTWFKNENWSINADEFRYATRLLCLRNGDRGKE